MVDTPDHVHIKVTANGQAIMTTSEPCQVHGTHSPKSHVNEIHHVWPLGDGGPNIPANKVVVCATGHNNIHALLDLFRRLDKTEQREPTFIERAHWGPGEQRLAALGWSRIKKGSM